MIDLGEGARGQPADHEHYKLRARGDEHPEQGEGWTESDQGAPRQHEVRHLRPPFPLLALLSFYSFFLQGIAFFSSFFLFFGVAYKFTKMAAWVDHQLPDEVSIRIFNYLDARELSEASLVSRAWLRLTHDQAVVRGPN